MKGIRFVTFGVWVYTLTAGISGQARPDAHGRSRVFVVNDVSYLHDANPGDGICDVGSGNCTLLAAIEEANHSPGRNTVVVPAGTYAAPGLPVSADLAVKGAGETDTVISCALGGAPAFLIDPSVKVEITGVTIANCGTAYFGGGIYNDGGDLTITNTKITNCGSLEGAGIISVNNGNVTIMDSEISHNGADAAGGIVIVGGNLTISHSQIVHNSAEACGGICNLGATATIVHSEISENYGVISMGGIYNSGTMTIKQSNVTGNTAAPAGCPGITNTGVLTIIASEIIGNTYYPASTYPGADLCNEGTLKLKSTAVGDCRGCD